MEGIEIIRLEGDNIPIELTRLTLGLDGMMFYWLTEDKSRMKASLVKLYGQVVAWACNVEMFPNTFGVGVYVADNMRLRGFGKLAMNDMLSELGSTKPNAIVRFGAENRRFNELYTSLIKANGMVPNHCYGSLYQEHRKAA